MRYQHCAGQSNSHAKGKKVKHSTQADLGAPNVSSFLFSFFVWWNGYHVYNDTMPDSAGCSIIVQYILDTLFVEGGIFMKQKFIL